MAHEKGSLTFQYSSAINAVHTITHNLGTLTPDVTVINDSTGSVVLPAEITVTTLNEVVIQFFSPVAIRGVVRK